MPAFIPHALSSPLNPASKPSKRRRHPLLQTEVSTPPPNLTLLHRRPDYTPSPKQTEPQKIAILGISHRSPHASSQIRQTIAELHPQAVLLELCRFRAGMLRTPNNIPGSEMRAAYEEARRIGAEAVLADIPITKTLSRAWGAVSWRDRFTLLLSLLLSSVLPIPDPVLLKAVLSGNATEVTDKYTALLRKRYPGLDHVLISRRDAYLAWSIRHSQAVSNTATVLAIVGAAHVPGVLKELREDDELRSSGQTPKLTFRQVAS